MDNEADYEHSIATYGSLISISSEGYKFLALINGGALVAMLAFIGNLVSKDVKVGNYDTPFYLFSCGLFACGLAMYFGYWTQYLVYNKRKEITTFAIAMVLYFSSLLLFLAGCYKSVETLKIFELQKSCVKM